MLPTTPTNNANGHTIVARIKKTGSSPIPDQIPSPNSFIKRANTRLCNIMLIPMPRADAPVRIKNALAIFVNFAFAARIISTIPRMDIIALKGMPVIIPI